MRWFTVSMVAAFLATALGGCGANFASIYRNYQIEKPNNQANSVLIDAKQRAILSAPASGAGSFTSPEDYHRGRDVIVCAEPSPDALSAISSTFAASGGGLFSSGDQVQASLAAALQETASQLGVRNATIQLLRDGLYRQCEAYMNGLIGEAYYEQIANKYVNAMLVLLATEELAGRGATSVKISGSEGTSSKTEASTQGGTGDSTDTDTDTDTETDTDTDTGNQESPTGGGSTSGEARAGAPTINVNLPESATAQQHVSTAVNTMVTWFLTKDTVDYCLRGLFSGEMAQDADYKRAFIEVCTMVIQQQMAQQATIANAYEASAFASTYGADQCSISIRKFWKPDGTNENAGNAAMLRAEMQRQNATGPISFMLSAASETEARNKVGAALGLAGCQ